MRWLDSITESMDMNYSKVREIAEDRGAWCATVQGLAGVGHDLLTEQQQACLRIKLFIDASSLSNHKFTFL